MFTVYSHSGLLNKASLCLLNMFIGIESHTLIVTSNIASHTHRYHAAEGFAV